MGDDCSLVDVGCHLSSAVGDAVGSATTSVFEEFVGWLMRGFLYGVRAVLTAWVNVNGPDLTKPESTVTQVQGQLLWLTMFVLLLGTLAAAGKMVLLRDGRPAADFGKSLLITVLVSAGAAALITSLMQFGDLFAQSLVDSAFSDQFVDKLAAGAAPAAGAAGGGAAAAAATGHPAAAAALFLPLLIGLLAVAAQLGLMYFRIAVLVAMAATLPLAAAGTGTVTGRKWFERLVGWCLAFIVYKPVAAILYVVGITLMQEDTDGITGIVSGVFLMVAAVVAMPALVKLMAPVAAAATGGGGGGSVAAASVAAGALGGPPGRAAGAVMSGARR